MGIFVKAASHRWRGKALTNIPMEKTYHLSTTKLISEYRNSDFQISGFAISERKNIQSSECQRVFHRAVLQDTIHQGIIYQDLFLQNLRH